MYVNAQNEVIPEGKSFKVGEVSYPANFDKSQIAGITKVTETEPPTEGIVTGYTIVDGVQVWQSRARTPAEEEDRKQAALERLASKRYAVEVGGTLVGGSAVETDREAQAKLVAVRIMAKEDPNYSVKWKTPAGFADLNATTIIAIADAVRNHVQSCFDREAELAADIEVAADPDAIDITAGWPAN